MDVERRGGGRITDPAEEPTDGPSIDLRRPPAVRAPCLLDQEADRDRLPGLVEALEPSPVLEGGRGEVHDMSITRVFLLTSY